MIDPAKILHDVFGFPSFREGQEEIVRAVLAGEIFAPPESTPADSFAQRAAQLTPQQWRVLALMVQGDQNKQIAHKLGVRSRTQAVIEARGLALPPPEPARP